MSSSFYPRFRNNNNKYLVYYPCKKNANTSATLFFIKHTGFEDKVYFIEDDVPRHLKFYEYSYFTIFNDRKHLQ